PTLNISGVTNPVVQIVDERNGEIVYTLRIAGQRWRPHVFAPGTYTVRVSDPDSGREQIVEGLVAGAEAGDKLEVCLASTRPAHPPSLTPRRAQTGYTDR
ncbi:MAG: hypothetical protein WBC51_12365, partial [Vicinamibacterales bacterium]